MCESIHCFEKAGLGKAPFRYVGLEYQEISYGQKQVTINGVQCETKPGGTCAYCGQYIVNMFNIESADGNRFHVGCDCLAKVGEAGMKKRADKAVREMGKKRKAAREKQRVENAKAILPKVSDLLASQPHPNEYRARQGETLLDWVKWVFANTSGLSAAKVVEQNQ